MCKKPLVSIIIATFNSEPYLQQAIESVFQQDYEEIELIVIDGGSKDKTVEIIRKYENKIAFWISEADKGIYDAWNKGLSYAKGEWIGFLGSDDMYLPGAIKAYVSVINNFGNNKQLHFISSKVNLVDKNLKAIRNIGEPFKWQRFRKFMCVAHVGSLHSSEYFKEYGLYDLSFKIVGDYEMLLRAGKYLKTAYLDNTTVNMRIGGVSNSNFKVFDETFMAKVKNGARGRFFGRLDYLNARIKFWVRNNILKTNQND